MTGIVNSAASTSSPVNATRLKVHAVHVYVL